MTKKEAMAIAQREIKLLTKLILSRVRKCANKECDGWIYLRRHETHCSQACASKTKKARGRLYWNQNKHWLRPKTRIAECEK